MGDFNLLLWYTGLVTEKYLRNPNTNCRTCNKKIYRRPSQIKNGNVFCSMECYGKNCRREIPCLVCKKPILSGLNKKTCSRKCSNIFRSGISYKTGRPKDKVNGLKALKRRIIGKRGGLCERCKYNKYKILQVHHKNRNRNDNSDSNLEILCPNCHYEEHLLKH